LDFVMYNLLPIFLMLCMYPAVTSIVHEKEHRLRMIMKMQGLPTYVYFLVTYIYQFCTYLLLIVLMSLFGYIANVQLFRIHNFGLLFAFLFFWGHLLVMFAFLLSTFFGNERTAGAVTFLLILIFWIVGLTLIQQFLLNPYSTFASFIPLLFFPPWVMMTWTAWFCLASAFGEAITTDNWSTVGGGALPTTLYIMIAWYVLAALLVWYLENAMVVGHGTSKGWCFCVRRSYWCSRGTKVADEKGSRALDKGVPEKAMALGFERPHDVEAEHQRTVDLKKKEDAPRVRIANMHKVFPASGKNKEKVAVQCVSFGVNDKECFGLLGHNGAGKTTLLNMLTGLFPPTSGVAMVDEYSIDTDLPKIYAKMGVCPQHDILWNGLTGTHHLNFFGRLKGFSGKILADMTKKALASVNLAQAGKRKAGGYSGGMKRRLSVANALVGGPEIVYMDEPSTGLDPASRRQLWDVISKAKTGKSMILTTHSMEEADVLCDRLAIMADGKLQCIGRSFQLKRRFGKGYTFTLTLHDKSDEASKRLETYIKSLFPSAALISEPIGGTSKFEISRDEVVLSQVFSRLQQDMKSQGIVDWGLTETTLEEVFLKLAALAELFSSNEKIVGTAKSISELDASAPGEQKAGGKVEF